MSRNTKLIRITTVPSSLKVLLRRQLRFMTTHYEVLAVSSPGQALEEVGTDEEIRTVSVAMTRAITPLKDIKALWQLFRLFKKEKPHIVHTHTPKAGLLGMMASRLAGVPVRMHTVAGLPLIENTGLKKRILELVERLTYACATKIYPNSKNLADFICQNNFCKPDKLKVLGNGSSNGIDMEFFRVTSDLIVSADKLRSELKINDNNFLFVFVGRLVKDKGIEELIEAFSGLKKTYSSIKLLLVGEYEDELDPISKQTRKTIEKDSDIIHVGFKQDVRPYLIISHVLTFPSYREGFPNAPMQAGCFDIPCIVTNINGCNEIIEHEKNGLIIPVKDSNALQIAMATLISNQALYLHLKSNARKLILERYEQKYFWNLLLKEYQDQLKEYAIVS